MKEAALALRQSFTTGLQESPDGLRNSDRLLYARNLRPYPGGMRLQQLPYPIVNGTFVKKWPFPQMYGVSVGIFLCSETQVSHFSDIFSPNSQIDTIAGNPWSVADFGKFAFLCNGSDRLYINPATGFLAQYTGDVIPLARCCGDFNRGQLILGSIKSSWYEAGDNYLVWSHVGNADCTPDDSLEAGYAPANFDGPIFCVKQLGQHMMVYGEQGIDVMYRTQSPVPTWGVNAFRNFGVPSRTAVAGDRDNHVFIDTAGELWKLTANMELTPLGGKSYIAPMLQVEDVVVTYHPRRKEVYVSGELYHYVHTKGGWGGPNYVPLSGAVYMKPYDRKLGGIAVVPVKAFTTKLTEAQFITETLDFERAAHKTIQWIEIQAEADFTQAYVAIDYRYNSRSSWATTVWTRLNPEGTVYLPVTGTSVRLRFKLLYPEYLEIDSMRVSWKTPDGRFNRGLAIAQKGVIDE